MTSHKNAHNFQHHFWAQFFMLFHLVWFILFGVLGQETTFSLVEILQQPIRNFQLKIFRANTWNKMDHIMWKSMKNCAQKWYRSFCAFLFEATRAFGKMCPAMGLNTLRWVFVKTHFTRLGGINTALEATSIFSTQQERTVHSKVEFGPCKTWFEIGVVSPFFVIFTHVV